MTHNFPVDFKFIYFQLWTKESHQGPNFEIFKCSGENLPNCSCYFPSHKSVFLQILHHSLVSWKITPLYFFRSNIIFTFHGRDKSKCTFFRTFDWSDQNLPNSHQFWNNKSFFLQILHQFSVSWDTTPLYLFSWNFIYFQQKEAYQGTSLVKSKV